MSNNKILTKQDLTRTLIRYVWARQAPFNYETMQSGGWTWAIYPAMAKIYDNDTEVLKAKFRQHFRFYNTHPWMGNVILGACLAIEESKEPGCTETAVDLRTALMGPLAGLGDSIIWVMLPTILGAIASYMALEGSLMGWFIAWVVQMVIWIAFWFMFYKAYDAGVEFVTSRSQQMANLTSAAGIVGLAVVGALIASTVNVKLGSLFEWKVGEVSLNLNDRLNMIIPHFMNVVTMAIIYWALGKSGMTTGKLVLIALVVGVVLGAVGVLG